MSNVIDLNEERIKSQPHASGECKCIACKYEWTGVVSVPVTADLECPKCGLDRGVYKYNFTSEIAWVCNCGCDVFAISPDNAVCLGCGSLKSLSELAE